MAAVAGLFALPWLALNLTLVGSVMPSGGRAVRFLSLAYGYRMMGATGPAFEPPNAPFEYFEATWLAAAAAIRKTATSAVNVRPAALLVALGAILGFRSTFAALRRMGFFFVFLLLLLLAYTLYIFGQWYFERYLAPYTIGYLLVLAASVWGGLRRVAPSEGPRRRALEVGLAAALALTLLADGITVTSPRSRGARGFYDAALWINQHTPDSALVGAFQTGIFGYYLERPFYGLDGKINIDALQALENKRIDDYIRAKRIEYLADWPFILEDLLVKRSRDPSYLERQQKVYANRDVVIYRLTAP